MTPERENRFAAGWADGLDDRQRATGRKLEGEDPDYGAGYVGAKYGQVLYQKSKTYDQGFRIWHAFHAINEDPHIPDT